MNKEIVLELAKEDLINAKCSVIGKYEVIKHLQRFITTLIVYREEYKEQIDEANRVIEKLRTKGTKLNKDIRQLLNSITM